MYCETVTTISLVNTSITSHSYLLFPKNNIKEEETFSNSFYNGSVTLIPKSDKDTIRKGNYRPISMISIDVKILNKTLANQIIQCMKRVIDHDQMGLILGKQGWFDTSQLYSSGLGGDPTG